MMLIYFARRGSESKVQMTHIGAKSILGFKMSMKCKHMSDSIVMKHIEARRRSLELCPNLKVEERSNLIHQVEEAGKYLRKRLRIIRLCSDNSWGAGKPHVITLDMQANHT
ncbi:uncharacterized protein LOC111708566 [Eurytemora carolleeae]|uniref:uncharacterized protein LOC111708566 n=1 Tax=Eurytemora carolleeae TaxID=1294199 RepID=UPI000C776FF7|nr:uncharacterized protein LOC111708566 [Eurytemora carolleeae]|eukprot:XP_023337755.1 uncharacterized protein LOC111708566 [Eurytemora affinis]